MSNQPLVSIIIPVYNRESLLTETLDSIMSQSFSDWECIVIDDGSTDKSNEVAEKFALKDNRFKVFIRPERYKAGGNGSRNYGFELSKGKYINWFDSDDVMLPDFIKTKIEMMREDLSFVISGGFFWDGRIIGKKMRIYNSTDFYSDTQTWRLQLITNCVMFNRQFLDGKYLFSEDIYRGQETEFFSRIFYRIPENIYKIDSTPTFLYRQHDHSISQNDTQYNPKFLYSRAKLHIENIERSVESGNRKLLQHQYMSLIPKFFKALNNNDKINANFIKDYGYQKLKKINYIVSYLFVFFCYLSIKFAKTHYITERLLNRLPKIIRLHP